MTTSFVGFTSQKIQQADWALVNHLTDLESEGMAVTAVAGDRTVQVATGHIVIKGVLCRVTAAETKQSVANSSGNPRIDRLIWRVDWSVPTATLQIKAGTPAANPVPPVLTQQVNSIWEQSIAQLSVANGQGAFTGGNITVIPSAVAALTAESNTNFTGTVTATYSAGSPVVGIVFVAPSSGKVEITVGGQVQNVTAAQLCALVYEVRTGPVIGSGTVVLPLSNGYGIEAGTSANTRVTASNSHILSGLTPGLLYNVRTLHGTSGGTGSVFFRELIVKPVK